MTAVGGSATASQVAARSRRIDLVSAECVRALGAAGIPSLLLKGPTTARWLYRDGVPRPYCDSDLLVPAERHADAEEVLAGLGFARRPTGRPPHEGASHAVALYRRCAAGWDNVDLHHRLGLVADPAARVWELLSRDAVPTEVAGQPMRMPGEGGRCLVVALQAAAGGQHATKALEDLRRARRIADSAAWAQALAMAAELGVDQALRVGCLLAGAPLPGTGAADQWATLPLELRLFAIGARPGARSIARVGQRRGRARLRYVARRLVPPREFMAQAYRARHPPALLWAYLRRLGRFGIRLPRAARDLVTANRVPATVSAVGGTDSRSPSS